MLELPTILGVILVAWPGTLLCCGWASRRWPVVNGQLLTRTVAERRNRSGPYYVAAVEYEYVVRSTRYTGRRRRFGTLTESFVTQQAAYDALDGLVPGTRVPVYHHPWLPRLAVLRPGGAGGGLLPLAAVGIAFLLQALLSWFLRARAA